MVEKIAENIYRIPVGLPGNPLKELNSYLIRDERRSLLIDTGFRMDACRADLFSGLRELGVVPGNLDVFLTHLHSDHAGLAPELAGTEGRIFVSAADRESLEDAVVIQARWAQVAIQYQRAGAPEGFVEHMQKVNPAVLGAPLPGCKQYDTVGDGDVLERGGYALTCVHTPGHTPGHLCLWAAKQQIMFTGDHVLFDITPNITTWTNLPNALSAYLTSLEQIRSYPVKIALPGHRKSGNFAARVGELIAHHHVRLVEAEQIVARTPGLTAYEITGQMTWSIRAKNWAEFPDAQKIFALGEGCAHLDYLEAEGRIHKEWDGHCWRYVHGK